MVVSQHPAESFARFDFPENGRNFAHRFYVQVIEALLSRVLAQTEVTFSNSLIESWWRMLKHQWLYLNTMDSAKTV